jgi:hypothetical protein
MAQSIRQSVWLSKDRRFNPRMAQNFFSASTPNVVSVRSVKNGKLHKPIDGISVAVNYAKGEIRVSENRTLGLRRWSEIGNIALTHSSDALLHL